MMRELTLAEHVEIVRRAQAIATSDHATLLRVRAELDEAHRQLRRAKRAIGRGRSAAAAGLAGRTVRRRMRGRGR